MLSLSLLLAFAAALVPQASDGLDESIDALLRPAIEENEALGLVVGVRTPTARIVRGFGRVRLGKRAVPDGDTVFEIGSVTKTFTGLLLADAIERGRASVDDPITKHVAKGVVVCDDEAPIQLRHLTTHTSGLPRLPTNMAPASMTNPYVEYSPEKLDEFLGDYVLESEAGETYAYSNLGAGLLGQLMARAHGAKGKGAEGYEAALRKRIFKPLGMGDTTIVMTRRLRPRFAQAAVSGPKAAEPWDFDALAGCGAIRSTVNDLLKFGVAQVSPDDTPLAASIRRSHERLFEGPPAVAYGWHFGGDDGEVLWHNGQTGGYHGWLSFDADSGVVVAILSNGGAGARIDKAAMELMNRARSDS